MEKLFGDYLVKCKVLQPPEPAAAAEESKEEAVDPDMPESNAAAAEDEVPFYPYE